ncbi:hypothetical protein AAGG74_19110 [Bacillus mexicanus]|uniref:hypothetical protein n=1 Tax=Bacillus mexicanus TaxID=2834415 RepID=UPI003D1A7704
MLQTFNKRDPKRFWRWFKRREKEFLNINDENIDMIYEKFYKYFNFYNPHIEVEFFELKKDNRMEITFTANGNKDLFDSIFTLVNAAPKDLEKRWIINALKQPRVNEVIIHFDEKTVSSKEIFYELEPSEKDPSMYDVFLNIKGIEYVNEKFETHVAETMIAVLDAVLGEYLVTMKINELILVEDGELNYPKTIINIKDDIKK